VLGARPRTLVAAVVPVAVATSVAWWSTRGTTSAAALGPAPAGVSWWRAILALVVALAVQVGTNYANDYSDGVRGTDDARVGPLRLVASGSASPAAVRGAAWAAFGVAGVAGLALAAATSWWVLLVGALCIAAGWLYTGGPKPYGYLGLGELFVFLFFGLVATLGTVYVEIGRFPAAAVVASLVVGCLATALLEANNLRDLGGDAVAGKRTLAVRLGRRDAGRFYVGTLTAVAAGVVVLSAWNPWALLALTGSALARQPARLALGDGEGRALLPVLAATARIQWVVGALLVIGFVVGGGTR
jgi:1,4-dihydroxy-2-naphthoate octaprenyltransferase